MHRTTVRLPEPPVAEAKRVAAATGRTLAGVVEDALREALARRPRTRLRAPVSFTTYGGYGLCPGVDLDNSAALLERMERLDDAG